MNKENLSNKALNLFLLLIALHALLVGLSLIFMPRIVLEQFGFQTINNNFFPIQGGIFHIIMAYIYYYTAKTKNIQHLLIPLIIGIKLFAAIFLTVYFLFFESILTILLSGIGDGLMSIILYFLFSVYLKTNRD